VRRILAAVRNPIHRGCFSPDYGCGLRISEAAALPVTAIDKTSGVLRVVGKGNKERVVPVPKEGARRPAADVAGQGPPRPALALPQWLANRSPSPPMS